ncbi:group XIIA secretory phospholipase A2 isoform X2 [Nerophis lumbriciformis]|uniref:group XIIA secretory phospholipase A2 isoform X2 n=1 Tax=Nerophis lumbriciformis TaxID=546530 RepID=UPI002AE01C41|nr:group XIIA secretory phospholipase A2-like isoform X2 [Nerophis lumbriciformis]
MNAVHFRCREKENGRNAAKTTSNCLLIIPFVLFRTVFVFVPKWAMLTTNCCHVVVLLVVFSRVPASVSACGQKAETPDWRMTLKTIRNGIHKIDTYLNAALDLFGGDDGLCHYRCSDGYKAAPRPGYKPPPPNGCGTPLFGFQFDVGIPSMTKCCNQHDRCYDTCGRDKHDCDEQFQECLETICRNVQRTLGLAQSVQACESAVTLLFDAVMHLGCKPYLDSQRDSCMCQYEGY